MRVEPTESGLLPWQEEVFLDPTRFRTCCCARRSGKTILALNELLRAAQAGSNQMCWYICPTYKMAKRLMWRMLKAAIPDELIKSKNETDLEIVLEGYNSVIALKGCEDPDALLGDSLSFVVFDEIQSVDMDVIDVIIRPAMSDQVADGLYIGTPRGKGTNTMYQCFMRGRTKPDWKSFSVDAYVAGVISLEEIESAKDTLPLPKFKQEYLASFEESQGRVYYNFSDTETIRDDLEDTGGQILAAMDFNVGNMSTAIAVIAGDELHFIDEILIENSNTRQMCEEINKRYPNRDVMTYPDPSCKARKTSAEVGQTDMTIIKSFGFGLIAPSKAPKIVDTINSVNAILQNANGVRKMFVHPKCENIIASLDGLMYKEGTSIPEKTGLDHFSDCIRYVVNAEFNIIKREVKILTLDTIF